MEKPEIKLIEKSRAVKEQAAPGDHVLANMRWALYLAGMYRRRALAYGIPWEDLQGEALTALVEANEAFPQSRAASAGQPFRAYATTAIKNRFLDAFRKATMVNLTSPAAWGEVFKLRGAIEAAQQEQQRGHIPEKDLARDLGWSVERVQKYRRLMNMLADHSSIDESVYEGESGSETYADTKADPNVDVEGTVLDRVAIEQEREWLSQATKDLPPLARTSVLLVFGLSPPADTPNPTVADVIRTAVGHSSNTRLGLRKLRGRRQDDRGDVPESVPGRRTFAHSGCWSGETITSKAGQHRAIDIWRRYSEAAAGPRAPEGQPAGTVGAME